MPLMDGVVGVSRFSLQNATSIYRMNAPSTVILNGISPDRLATSTERRAVREAEGVGDHDVVLLFVGFLESIAIAEMIAGLLSAYLSAGSPPRLQGYYVEAFEDGSVCLDVLAHPFAGLAAPKRPQRLPEVMTRPEAEADVQRMIHAYDERRRLMLAGLNELVASIQLGVRERLGAQEIAVVSGIIKEAYRKLGVG